MVYDELNQVTVLFGGQDGYYNAETWVFELDIGPSGPEGEWTRLYPAHSPSPRSSMRMTYDHTSEVTVLFCGLVGSGPSAYLDDTWVYKYA